MVSNQFFLKQGPFSLKEIIEKIGSKENYSDVSDLKINGVESLSNSKKFDMTFLNSVKYKDLCLKTKASACITSHNLSQFIPDECIKINVKNVLFAVTSVSKMFYPNADFDLPDTNLQDSENLKTSYENVNFGKNQLN